MRLSYSPEQETLEGARCLEGWLAAFSMGFGGGILVGERGVQVFEHGVNFLVELREAHLLVRSKWKKRSGAFAAGCDKTGSASV